MCQLYNRHPSSIGFNIVLKSTLPSLPCHVQVKKSIFLVLQLVGFITTQQSVFKACMVHTL